MALRGCSLLLLLLTDEELPLQVPELTEMAREPETACGPPQPVIGFHGECLRFPGLQSLGLESEVLQMLQTESLSEAQDVLDDLRCTRW